MGKWCRCGARTVLLTALGCGRRGVEGGAGCRRKCAQAQARGRPPPLPGVAGLPGRRVAAIGPRHCGARPQSVPLSRSQGGRLGRAKDDARSGRRRPPPKPRRVQGEHSRSPWGGGQKARRPQRAGAARGGLRARSRRAAHPPPLSTTLPALTRRQDFLNVARLGRGIPAEQSLTRGEGREAAAFNRGRRRRRASRGRGAGRGWTATHQQVGGDRLHGGGRGEGVW